MKLVELGDSVDATLFSEDNRPRTTGLHLSQILDDIEKTLGQDYRDHPWDMDPCRALGFLMERVIQSHLIGSLVEAGALIRPGEICRDGIYMTPDGWNVKEEILEEWKVTWKSARRPIESFDRYWWQIKAYCYGLATSRARLRVFFTNGDYRGSGPRLQSWEAEFTERELGDNWTMIRNHARGRGWL